MSGAKYEPQTMLSAFRGTQAEVSVDYVMFILPRLIYTRNRVSVSLVLVDIVPSQAFGQG